MRPVELYTIALAAQTWYLSDSESTISIVEDFVPLAISRGQITTGQEPVDITMPASHAFPQTYVNSAPGTHANVTIQWLDRDDSPDSLRALYKGVAKSVSFTQDGTKAIVHVESIVSTFDKETPEDTFTPQCQAYLYDDRCTVNKDDFKYEGTVTDMSGNTITVDGLSAEGAGWALPGYVAYGTSDYRQVLAQSGDILTIILPFTVDLVGETVAVYAGCNHSMDDCENKFSNLVNFRGTPYVPTKNVFRTGLK